MEHQALSLLAAALIASTALHAQDKGFAGIVSSPGHDYGLLVGRNVCSHMAWGVDVRYGREVDESVQHLTSPGWVDPIDIVTRVTTETWSIAPFVRGGPSFGKHWQVFAQLRMPVSRAYSSTFKNISDHFGPDEGRSIRAGALVGPGVQFKFTQHWAITADFAPLSYTYEHFDKEGDPRSEVAFKADLSACSLSVFRSF